MSLQLYWGKLAVMHYLFTTTMNCMKLAETTDLLLPT